MQLLNNKFILSPTDLNKYLNCKHYINLEKKRLKNNQKKISVDSPLFKILSEKGFTHENQYLQFLKKEHKQVIEVSDKVSFLEREQITLDAVEKSIEVIYQPFIASKNWLAIPDFFVKDVSNHEFIVVDTKLKKSLIPEHIYQSVMYALIAQEKFNIIISKAKIISPANQEGKFLEHSFLIKNYSSNVKDQMNELEEYLYSDTLSRPIPCTMCKNCEFKDICDEKLLNENSLFVLPNITRLQEKRLREVNIYNIPDLLNSNTKPVKMAKDTFTKLKLKAELRSKRLNGGQPSYKIMDKSALKMLPKKSDNDIFFDIEGDPLVEGGLEYLFGLLIQFKNNYNFIDVWAHNHEEEKNATKKVILQFYNHCKKNPNAHIYHYNSYEVSALRRLSQKYNTCEFELDELLRAEKFIDLYTIVRKFLITSEKSMSLKDLEIFFIDKRTDTITDAASSIIMYEAWTKTSDNHILDEIKLYNEQDCKSLPKLRDWMENTLTEGFENYKDTTHLKEHTDTELSISTEKSKNENLAIALSQFHEKEDKPYWWSYFDARISNVEDLIPDSSVLAGLVLKKEQERADENEYKYNYPEQDHKFSIGSKVAVIVPDSDFGFAGEILFISDENSEVTLKINKAGIKSFSIIHLKEPQPPNTINIKKNLKDFMKSILYKGAETSYPASFSLLSQYKSNIDKQQKWPESILEHKNLYDKNKPLFIQGPPGSGKTYQGAMFLKNIIKNKKGTICLVTSQSHKAIENILLYFKQISSDSRNIIFKYGGKANDKILHLNGYDKLFSKLREARLNKNNLIIGLTVFSISKLRDFTYQDKKKPSDFLIIDEAGQYGLANSVAAAMFTENVILLGDQNQLPNVTQGSHPMGIENSVMSFCLGNNSIVGQEYGIFLPITRRLHPKICSYISDAFYQSQLKPHEDNKNRQLIIRNTDNTDISGINLIELEHEGCAQISVEEQNSIDNKINYLMKNCHLKINNQIKNINYKDFIIVSPYNAQVNYLKSTLNSNLNIGTVDKFQGQEAPITIISMTSSTIEDAPKGVNFILNENRLNVAISRAQIAVFLFCSKDLFNAVGNTLNQMKLINNFHKIKEYVN